MTLIEFGTQQCQFCPKVAASRDGACDFFRYSPVNNALSPSRAVASSASTLKDFSFF